MTAVPDGAMVPVSDLDPFDDAVLLDPYHSYRRLRDAGPVVWMRRHDMWALARYAEVRLALRDWETYSSAAGVAMTREFNDLGQGILTSDPPEHDRFRHFFQDQMSPRALRSLEDELQPRADELVHRLTEQRTFDAVRDLAEQFTVDVVADYVGLPMEGRDELLANSDAAFNRFGPANAHFHAAEDGFGRLIDYVTKVAIPGRLAPGGKASEIYAAVDAGTLPSREGPGMMLVYAWPSIDTTISAISSAVQLFARHPDQWDLVREEPDLVAAAFNEVLRLEAPVQLFTRRTTRDVTVGDVALPAGSRVMVMMGSANRDERHYQNPDRFDVRRNPTDHLGFGHGIHYCVGAGLARLEAHAVIRALAQRVERFTEIHSDRHLNNVIRRLHTLQVRVS